MKKYTLIALVPFTLLLSACTAVQPVYKDNGTRSGTCIAGGPDEVARAFYHLRQQQAAIGLPDSSTLAKYRPYLSDTLYQGLVKTSNQSQKKHTLRQRELFSSLPASHAKAEVNSASAIPNRDARNIPLRVNLNDGEHHWQDEVLMIREGTCWVIDDIRYLSPASPADSGTLNQLLGK
ncbi:lipoprotein [Enterobacteriaceae bacterium LUAb1]